MARRAGRAGAGCATAAPAPASPTSHAPQRDILIDINPRSFATCQRLKAPQSSPQTFPQLGKILIYKNSRQYQKLLWFIIFAPLAYQLAGDGRAETPLRPVQGRQPRNYSKGWKPIL
jgi:hypothetical protein